MLRTPPKTSNPEDHQSPPMAANITFEIDPTPTEGMEKISVRRSVGEWETGTPDPQPSTKSPPAKKNAKDTAKKTAKPTTQQDRVAEARGWVTKAKANLGESRNISTVIKTQVILAIDKLYALVKDAEVGKSQSANKNIRTEPEKNIETRQDKETEELLKSIEEHKTLLKENTKRIEELKEIVEKKTYASVAAAPTGRTPLGGATLHSIVVSGKSERETGEDVLNRIREVVNAKEGWITVDSIRKAKDRKIIVGCKTIEERQKLKERLNTAQEHLHVEEMKNRDPLIILKDVLKTHSDDDIRRALQNQNKSVFAGCDQRELGMEICYRKRARNPHLNHVVMRVSPKLWQRMTGAEVLLLDLQRIRVADQSPLVQCSMCLGYGHSRRLCKETQERCSHCGGLHLKSECADWLAGAPPSCTNCMHAKLEKTEHNAFSTECPVRKRWDSLARAKIAYC